MTYAKVVVGLIGHTDNDLVLVTKRRDQLCDIATRSFDIDRIRKALWINGRSRELTLNLP